MGAPAGTRALISLQVEDVCGMLHALDLGMYDAGFRANLVNGIVLDIVSEEDLEEVPRRLSCFVRS